MTNPNVYRSSSKILDMAKDICDIDTPNEEMSDDEIASVMRSIGYTAPDTVWHSDEEPELGPEGIGLMLSITLYEFPEFYEKHELWQRN